MAVISEITVFNLSCTLDLDHSALGSYSRHISVAQILVIASNTVRFHARPYSYQQSDIYDAWRYAANSGWLIFDLGFRYV